MNSQPDIGSDPTGDPSGASSHPEARRPVNWRQALMDLIAARIDLILLESKEASTGIVKSLIFIIAAIVAGVFAWAFLVAGCVALISHATGWSWSWVAIGAGILHLLAVFILAKMAKPSGAPSFPTTRAEFRKDREWIENFQTQPKHGD